MEWDCQGRYQKEFNHEKGLKSTWMLSDVIENGRKAISIQRIQKSKIHSLQREYDQIGIQIYHEISNFS